MILSGNMLKRVGEGRHPCRTPTVVRNQPRLKSDLEKLKDPKVLETFQTITCGKFAPLTIMNNEDADMDSMITTFNTAMTETASEILGKHFQNKNPGSPQKFSICATKGQN